MRDLRGVTFAVLALLVARPASADSYFVSIPDGLVSGPANIVGMGGANVALGEGSNGLFFNPAAAASRSPLQNKRFNLDFAFGGHNADGGNDLENAGRPSAKYATIYMIGLAAVVANAGYGIELTQLDNFYVTPEKNVGFTSQIVGVTGAYGFFGGQAMLAGRADFGTTSLYVQDLSPSVVDEQRGSANGESGSVGLIVRPERQRFRLGFAARAPLKAEVKDLTGAGEVFDFGGLHRPWQVSAGGAFAFGPRILNPRPFRLRPTPPPNLASGTTGFPGFSDLPVRSPGRERYLVIAVDAIVTGPGERTVSTDSFARTEPLIAVDRPTFGVRAGAESEVWPNHLRLRLGTYYEPSRFKGVPGRLHSTGSVELHPFRFPVVDLVFVASMDVADRFQSLGFTVSVWH